MANWPGGHHVLSKYGRIRIPVPEVISAALKEKWRLVQSRRRTTAHRRKQPPPQCISRPPGNTGSDLEKGGRVEYAAREGEHSESASLVCQRIVGSGISDPYPLIARYLNTGGAS